MRRRLASSLSLLAITAAAACSRPETPRPDAVTPAPEAPVSPALRIALAPHQGDAEIDAQIRTVQAAVRERADVPRLERLAAMFIAKARRSGDAGFYRLAEACADAMPAAGDGAAAASLVRGHVRHSLHDFAAAERIARELAATRGLFLDHGLLGDVLLDQGRLDEARDVYQRMLDLKPCLQSYARAAQLRWLGGDLAGARELLVTAASAGSQRDPESIAWVLSRRALLELQAGDAATARALAEQALGLVADYPAALLAHGRAAWEAGDRDAALQSLARAVERSPLPEHLWARADALRAAGRAGEAAAVDAELLRTGEREDPRTFALWLATRERELPQALRLAEAELRVRQDALTWDTVAWARLRSGDVEGARAAMRQALAPGLQEARVLLHAAAVAIAAGERDAAARHCAAARERAGGLLPGEREELERIAALL